MSDYDLAVIGSGSAAFAAAIRARDLGASVAMIERGTIGGTCVNIGCIPSKTLIRAADTRWRSLSQPFEGIFTNAEPTALQATVAQKDTLVEAMRQAKYVDLLDEYGIALLRGEAKFADPATLQVAGDALRADRIVLATGARPALPDIPGLAGAEPLTPTSALSLADVPERLVVLGGGYVGLELGQAFAHFGSKVTILARSTLMRDEEPQVDEVLLQVLADDGIDVVRHADVLRVELRGDERVVLAVVNGEEREFRADELLVATGREASTDSLAAHAGGVDLDADGHILANTSLQTSNPDVYAAGDVVAGLPKFVYVAARAGATAAQNALTGERAQLDFKALPRVTFTTPTIAAAGLTDAEANRRGITCSCRTLPLDAVPRALVNHDTRGFVKLVIDRDTRKLLGGTIMAEGAADAIQAIVYAIELGATVDQLAEMWAPYLTFGEAIKLAALNFTRDVNKLSCCAA